MLVASCVVGKERTVSFTETVAVRPELLLPEIPNVKRILALVALFQVTFHVLTVID